MPVVHAAPESDSSTLGFLHGVSSFHAATWRFLTAAAFSCSSPEDSQSPEPKLRRNLARFIVMLHNMQLRITMLVSDNDDHEEKPTNFADFKFQLATSLNSRWGEQCGSPFGAPSS